jgi:hypothetical protein
MKPHASTTLDPQHFDDAADRQQIVPLMDALHEPGVHGSSLVERLDPALGEATSGMGALLTELIRRTLRGGVQRIDDELQTQVEEKVDATVTDCLPRIESAASHIAQAAARQVAGQECQAIEREVKDTASRLDDQLVQTRQELASTEDKLAETKRQLAATELKLTAAEGRLAETHQSLSQQIISTSHRVEKTARDFIHEQVQNLTQRSKTTLQSLNGRLERLDSRADAGDLRLEQLEAQLIRMAGRIIELEKPRGLRRLWLAIKPKRRKAKQ